MSLITTTTASGFFASSAHPWRTRFVQFGPSGWLGLAIVLFWTLAAVFGPALLSRPGAAGVDFVQAPPTPTRTRTIARAARRAVRIMSVDLLGAGREPPVAHDPEHPRAIERDGLEAWVELSPHRRRCRRSSRAQGRWRPVGANAPAAAPSATTACKACAGTRSKPENDWSGRCRRFRFGERWSGRTGGRGTTIWAMVERALDRAGESYRPVG